MPDSIAFFAGFLIAWICGSILRAVLGEYAKRLWFSHIEPHLIVLWAQWSGREISPTGAAQPGHIAVIEDVEQQFAARDRDDIATGSARPLCSRAETLECELAKLRLESPEGHREKPEQLPVSRP
jgi:hypothetical protein